MRDVLRDFQLAMRNVDLWLVLGEHRNCRCLACENLRQLLLKWQGIVMGIDVSRYEEFGRIEDKVERLTAALSLSEEYNEQKDGEIKRLQAALSAAELKLEEARMERDHLRQVIRDYVGQQVNYGCPENASQDYRALFAAASQVTD